ncbi:unnamed protein product [Amoebophrya sp. A120]|nr:unnamed protein product [Amoebophrya sp. A120]|eukprot:GSA120T00004659001.1
MSSPPTARSMTRSLSISLPLVLYSSSCATTTTGKTLRSQNSFLLAKLSPERVSELLSETQQEWISFAVDQDVKKEGTELAKSKMVTSCTDLVTDLVTASEGDKDRLQDYFQEVCQNDGSDSMCGRFTTGVMSVLSDDMELNRENERGFNGFCTNFWSTDILQTAEKQIHAKEAAELEAKKQMQQEKLEAERKAAAAQEHEKEAQHQQAVEKERKRQHEEAAEAVEQKRKEQADQLAAKVEKEHNAEAQKKAAAAAENKEKEEVQRKMAAEQKVLAKTMMMKKKATPASASSGARKKASQTSHANRMASTASKHEQQEVMKRPAHAEKVKTAASTTTKTASPGFLASAEHYVANMGSKLYDSVKHFFTASGKTSSTAGTSNTSREEMVKTSKRANKKMNKSSATSYFRNLNAHVKSKKSLSSALKKLADFNNKHKNLNKKSSPVVHTTLKSVKKEKQIVREERTKNMSSVSVVSSKKNSKVATKLSPTGKEPTSSDEKTKTKIVPAATEKHEEKKHEAVEKTKKATGEMSMNAKAKLVHQAPNAAEPTSDVKNAAEVATHSLANLKKQKHEHAAAVHTAKKTSTEKHASASSTSASVGKNKEHDEHQSAVASKVAAIKARIAKRFYEHEQKEKLQNAVQDMQSGNKQAEQGKTNSNKQENVKKAASGVVMNKKASSSSSVTPKNKHTKLDEALKHLREMQAKKKHA